MVDEARRYLVKYLRVSPEEIYRATTEDLAIMGSDGQVRRARLHRSEDNGLTWQEIPLTLTPMWRLLNRLFPANWPPQFIDEIQVSGGNVSFTFHDSDNDWEWPILPGKLDVPSIWSAQYRSRSGQWTLRRVRHLDYDGADRDLKWKDVKRLETPEPDQGPPSSSTPASSG
jgi:hypothetical protein